jgi:hypothetical protein
VNALNVLYILLLLLSLAFAIVATVTSGPATPEVGSAPGWRRTHWLALSFALFVATVLLGVLFGGPVVIVR